MLSIDKFLEYLRSELNRSQRTVENYREDLKLFEQYARNLSESFTWESVDSDMIRNWMEHMIDAGNKATSVNRRLSALKMFYRFALVRHYVESDPAHNLKGPKESKPLPQFLKENGCYIPNNGNLEKWAKQGVLLLNTVLTVRAHQANSHRGIGWEQFTDAAIRILDQEDRPIVFLLWGRPAQMKASMLHNPKHLILEAPHPSPLSAYRGFFGCRHFSKANEFLKANGVEPVDWQIENI